MTTLYENFRAGLVSDDPLTDSATTINSAGFEFLPTVAAPDVMWLVLDPAGDDGEPEIVQVTAHTAAATSVTVLRGRQDTTARAHDENTRWVHAATRADLEGFATTADVAADVAALSVQNGVTVLESNLTITTGGVSLEATITAPDDGAAVLAFNGVLQTTGITFPSLSSVEVAVSVPSTWGVIRDIRASGAFNSNSAKPSPGLWLVPLVSGPNVLTIGLSRVNVNNGSGAPSGGTFRVNSGASLTTLGAIS